MERAVAIIVGCVGALILTIGAVFWVQSREGGPVGVDLLGAAAEARRSAAASAQAGGPPTTALSAPPPSSPVLPSSSVPSSSALPLPSTSASPTATSTSTTAVVPGPAPTVPGSSEPSPALASLIDRVNHGGLRFAYRSATLEPAAGALLDELAAVLRAEPSVRLVVLGHTDSDGELVENEALSARRATVAIDRLVTSGVAPSQLRPLAMGERAPIAANGEEAGREANRRVDLLVDRGAAP